MTVTPHSGGNLPANMDDLDTGLDDFGLEDAVVPRVTIVHKEGVWKDSLSNETFQKLRVIMLGLVKQRILWDSTVDEGDLPMCKSPDHNTGFPNVSEDVKKDKRFPWAKSGFRKEDFEPDENGFVQLPCSGCKLKEWGSHPDGKKPFCSETFTIPILYDPYDDGAWVPAITTFQKTALKPLKTYLSGFSQRKGAAYMAVTEMALTLTQRGTTDYSVPKFTKVDDTDTDDWRGYSASYRQLREFLTAFPVPRDDDPEGGDAPAAAPASNEARPAEDAPVKEEPKAEPKAAPAPEPAKTPEPAPTAAADDDDDLPF